MLGGWLVRVCCLAPQPVVQQPSTQTQVQLHFGFTIAHKVQPLPHPLLLACAIQPQKTKSQLALWDKKVGSPRHAQVPAQAAQPPVACLFGGLGLISPTAVPMFLLGHLLHHRLLIQVMFAHQKPSKDKSIVQQAKPVKSLKHRQVRVPHQALCLFGEAGHNCPTLVRLLL